MAAATTPANVSDKSLNAMLDEVHEALVRGSTGGEDTSAMNLVFESLGLAFIMAETTLNEPQPFATHCERSGSCSPSPQKKKDSSSSSSLPSVETEDMSESVAPDIKALSISGLWSLNTNLEEVVEEASMEND